MRHHLVLGLLLVLPLPVLAQETGRQNHAVLALVSGQEAREAALLAGMVQEKLAGRVEILSLAELTKRLGGVGALTGDIEALRGKFQQAYLQSYSFKYDAAIRNLEQVLAELQSVPDSAARWDLWVQANIYLGKSLAEKGDRKTAGEAFLRALRVRQKLQLSRKEHSPKTVELWEEIRQALKSVPTGRINVDTEPRHAEVYLDGVRVGQTPWTAYFHPGRYFMKVTHQDAGSAYRWVEIGEEEANVRLQLSFEGAIDLGQAHPAISIPRGKDDLPEQWWPWLGERLSAGRIVAIRRTRVGNSTRSNAALVDGQSGKVLRQGWLESSGPEKEHLAVDAIDLADFMVTGKAGKRVTQVVPGGDKPPEVKPEPSLVVEARPRPFYRKWWPASLLGALFISGGSVALYVSLDYADDGGLKSRQDSADTWMGIAVAGYAVGSAIVLAGIISDLTFDPGEDPFVTVSPYFMSGEMGVQLTGRF